MYGTNHENKKENMGVLENNLISQLVLHLLELRAIRLHANDAAYGANDAIPNSRSFKLIQDG